MPATLVQYLDMQNIRAREFIAHTPESLGAGIRLFRRQAGMSQAELARRTGLHASYLSELESGLVTRQLVAVVRCLRELGIEVVLRPREP